MSRKLLELEPSTPTRAIATVSTPSPMTRRYNSSTLYAFLFLMSTVLICFYIHLQPQKDTRTWRHHRASCFSNHISGCYWEGKDKKIEGCQVQKILVCWKNMKAIFWSTIAQIMLFSIAALAREMWLKHVMYLLPNVAETMSFCIAESDT